MPRENDRQRGGFHASTSFFPLQALTVMLIESLTWTSLKSVWCLPFSNYFKDILIYPVDIVAVWWCSLVNHMWHRGQQFIWDHLRMEDVSCYWKKLLLRYAKMHSWKPKRINSYREIRQKHDELWCDMEVWCCTFRTLASNNYRQHCAQRKSAGI